MNLRTSPSALLAVLAASTLLAACGGGDRIEAPLVDDMVVPASATASVTAFNAFVAQVPLDDTREPLTLGATPPPTSDEDEPVSVAR